MCEGYNKELIERFEEEIDHGKVMIYKTIIASLMHKRESRLRLVELHYLSLINIYIERMADHIVSTTLDAKTKEFLMDVRAILERLSQMMKKEQQGEKILKEDAIEFFKNVKQISGTPLIHSKLNDISEVLMDWAITNEI